MARGRWKKTAHGTLLSQDGRWSIRPVTAIGALGGRIYWLYKDGGRFTPTGNYEDAVNFGDAAEAMGFVDRMTTGSREKCARCLHVGAIECLELRLAQGIGLPPDQCKSFLEKAVFPYGSKLAMRRMK